MTLQKPWTRKVIEELEDGDWHDIESVVRATEPSIPPEIAYRRGESLRSTESRGDMGDSIAAGRRHIVQSTINNHVALGRIERRGDHIRLDEPRVEMIRSHDLKRREYHSPDCAKVLSDKALRAEKADHTLTRSSEIVLMILRDACDCGAPI